MDLIFLRIKNVYPRMYSHITIANFALKKRTPPKTLSISWSSSSSLSASMLSLKNCFFLTTGEYYITTRHDPCQSYPCHNGGTCYTNYAYSRNYYCSCPYRYSGQNCDYYSPGNYFRMTFFLDDLGSFQCNILS